MKVIYFIEQGIILNPSISDYRDIWRLRIIRAIKPML